jgi:hypothetical protein
VPDGEDRSRPDLLAYFTDRALPLAAHRHVTQLGVLPAHGQHLTDIMGIVGVEKRLRPGRRF